MLISERGRGGGEDPAARTGGRNEVGGDKGEGRRAARVMLRFKQILAGHFGMDFLDGSLQIRCGFLSSQPIQLIQAFGFWCRSDVDSSGTRRLEIILPTLL